MKKMVKCYMELLTDITKQSKISNNITSTPAKRSGIGPKKNIISDFYEDFKK